MKKLLFICFILTLFVFIPVSNSLAESNDQENNDAEQISEELDPLAIIHSRDYTLYKDLPRHTPNLVTNTGIMRAVFTGVEPFGGVIVRVHRASNGEELAWRNVGEDSSTTKTVSFDGLPRGEYVYLAMYSHSSSDYVYLTIHDN
ncbi:hypothetical protein [Alkalibacillus haloalkaliphilus]|uniref:hypothetical protein n=1 Tax=Alkalibacillus haloalkaliphilus TaxID=94136 RepID=UPI00293604D5|nr:hypothetical protein [Alkalibacillus haloalkaliphilus]MDV2583478.1 hypothetical protein [Alkalibacillus haloalkaliphilus]